MALTLLWANFDAILSALHREVFGDIYMPVLMPRRLLPAFRAEAAACRVRGEWPVKWREFEAGAPEMSAFAREQLEQSRVMVIATIRRDGSPRISMVEPFVVGE